MFESRVHVYIHVFRERKEREERRLRGEPESETEAPDPAHGGDPFKQINTEELARKVRAASMWIREITMHYPCSFASKCFVVS